MHMPNLVSYVHTKLRKKLLTTANDTCILHYYPLCKYFIYMNISIRKRPSITRKSSLKQKEMYQTFLLRYILFETPASVLNVCFTVIKNTPFRASVLSNCSFLLHLHFACIQNYSHYNSTHTYPLHTL